MSKAVKYGVGTLSLPTILIAGFLFYSFAGHVVVAEYFKREGTPSLKFTFSRCTNTQNEKHEIISSEWNKDNVFVLKGVVIPDCGTTWIFGSYKVNENQLTLIYSPVMASLLACTCAHNVEYKVTGDRKSVV